MKITLIHAIIAVIIAYAVYTYSIRENYYSEDLEQEHYKNMFKWLLVLVPLMVILFWIIPSAD